MLRVLSGNSCLPALSEGEARALRAKQVKPLKAARPAAGCKGCRRNADDTDQGACARRFARTAIPSPLQTSTSSLRSVRFLALPCFAQVLGDGTTGVKSRQRNH